MLDQLAPDVLTSIAGFLTVHDVAALCCVSTRQAQNSQQYYMASFINMYPRHRYTVAFQQRMSGDEPTAADTDLSTTAITTTTTSTTNTTTPEQGQEEQKAPVSPQQEAAVSPKLALSPQQLGSTDWRRLHRSLCNSVALFNQDPTVWEQLWSEHFLPVIPEPEPLPEPEPEQKLQENDGFDSDEEADAAAEAAPVVERLSPGELFSRDHRESAATFMSTYFKQLDRRSLALYLMTKTPHKNALLRTLMSTFDFRGMNFAWALQALMCLFTLPKASKATDKLLHAFGKTYALQNPEQNFGHYTGYILAFSLVMLATDQHNKAIKTKQTVEGFLRGVADTKVEGVSKAALSEMYTAIKLCPILKLNKTAAFRGLVGMKLGLIDPRVTDVYCVLTDGVLNMYEHTNLSEAKIVLSCDFTLPASDRTESSRVISAEQRSSLVVSNTYSHVVTFKYAETQTEHYVYLDKSDVLNFTSILRWNMYGAEHGLSRFNKFFN